jgi:hypothetical protein
MVAHAGQDRNSVSQGPERDRATRLLPELLAQHPLEDLAGRVPRQLVRELDRRRAFVPARCAFAKAMTSGAVTGSAEGCRTTTALTVSPHRGDGTPITGTSLIPGCAIRTFSTSIGYTFSPPETIMSLIRSFRSRYPSRR